MEYYFFITILATTQSLIKMKVNGWQILYHCIGMNLTEDLRLKVVTILSEIVHLR